MATPAQIYEPMNIYAAIEAMKILAPYAREMNEGETPLEMLRVFMGGLKKDGAEENALRMMALMQHKPIEEVVAQFQGAEAGEFLIEMFEALQINGAKDLLHSAALLGLTPTRIKNANG